MKVFGVLKESGKWIDGLFGKIFKTEDSWTVLCNSEEEARNEAEKMWDRLCTFDKKESVITAVKRDFTPAELNLVKEEYFSVDDDKQLKEIAVSENYNVIEKFSMQN